MTMIKWVFWSTIWLLVIAVFHYTLPQVDIVRVTDTYEKRIDPGENALFWSQADVGSDGTMANRDVFFIQTRRAKGDVMVYRNEDTGWGWPPYFKFDTSNLQAEAADAKSTADAAQYYAIKHYGWRNEFFTIFPNAISLRPVEGPEASKGIPFLNIFIITLFAAIVWAIYVRWRRFRMSRIDPTLEAIEDDMAERSGAVKRWLGTWKKKA
ncbi:DUF1523 family protein [Sulfitobacter geojensis]|uniref:DUF1523 family protein n=1 Tax=Sulfitobacter geojensis TaxID=1342299 RepID=A0AAE3B747_9RHOB|nr:DUF1523 family protein [Sulfitobacter geojensis]MBM1694637.1 DUF1523 family protein [Sulfitobacter geojensis]MBM1706803.1 DUF1523 family protein [Sulfitobacter geojensis]MBM1710861.1 DUF1523 family protein [Sulfitobacter geojensis]MBM1714927.1 DUF1523 family protein [Sulfitobacter geojensis]